MENPRASFLVLPAGRGSEGHGNDGHLAMDNNPLLLSHAKDNESKGAPLHQARACPMAVTNTPGDNWRTNKETTSSHPFRCPFLCPGLNLVCLSPCLLLACFLLPSSFPKYRQNHLYFMEVTGWISPCSNKDCVYGNYLEFHWLATIYKKLR